MASQKKSILIIGGGSVGAIAALNLTVGGLADVTLVLRSNYPIVSTQGFTISSIDHGQLTGWKPHSIRNSVPDLVAENLPPYDYIVLATKNVPDISPTAVDLVRPALPPDNTHTTLVLVQNGLNIEKPFQRLWPDTVILSGVSLIGSAEPELGTIEQDDHDKLLIGAFPPLSPSPSLPQAESESKATEFVTLYAASKKTICTYSPAVPHDRWRKLVYNACLNPICAITGLDTGRIRLADGAVEGLVRPAMREIVQAARVAAGVVLEEDVVQKVIEVDALELFLAPSMLADVRKGNYIEYENLLGEPLREGKKAGVAMPTLEVLYQISKAMQWRTMETKGKVKVPEKRKKVDVTS